MEAPPLRAGFTVRPDPWLSGILCRTALRLIPTDNPTTEWKKKLNSQDLFVTAKVPAEQVREAGLLQDIGFRMIDAALLFESEQVPKLPLDPRVRFVRPEDRPHVVGIAGSSFLFNRFLLDPVIPNALAHRIKAAWAANFFGGQRGDGIVVAEHEGAVAGFLQLIWAADNVLVIDLIAVAPHAARRGMARAMIGFAAMQGTGDARRPKFLRVGTQAANMPSVRLYESLGFRFRQAEFVLHHHGRGGPYPEGNAS